MKNLLLFAVLVSLPLLLGGCGEKGDNVEELEYRGGVLYLQGSDAPYTGKSFDLYENGQKSAEWNYKDGKEDGLQTTWYENGQKEMEGNWKDGKEDGLGVEWYENGQKAAEENIKDGKLISGKYWNSKGEPISLKEFNQERY